LFLLEIKLKFSLTIRPRRNSLTNNNEIYTQNCNTLQKIHSIQVLIWFI